MYGLRLVYQSTDDFLRLKFLLLGQANRSYGKLERLVGSRQEFVETLDQEGMGERRVVADLVPLTRIAVTRRRLGHERAKVLVLVVLGEQLLELGDPGNL